MKFTSKQNNSAEDIQASVQQGVWTDHTTQPNRYEDLLHGLKGRADFYGEDEVDILDVGCSSGEAIEYFAEEVESEYEVDVNVVGLDIGDEVIEEAENNGRVDEGYQGKAQNMEEFDDGEFDIVTSKTLLSRISGGQQSEALREINRVVSDEGYATVQVDPEGGRNPVTGTSYVMTGDEMEELSEETGGFEEYSIAEELEPHAAKKHFPEPETSSSPDNAEGNFITSTKEVAESYEEGQPSEDGDDDIIVA